MSQTHRAADVLFQKGEADRIVAEGPTAADFFSAGGEHEAGVTYRPEQLPWRVPYRPVPASPRREGGRIDGTLIQGAVETIASIDPNDAFETPLNLNALTGTVLQMWESAVKSSEQHREILAILENGVRQVAYMGSATAEQLGAFREALTDLTRDYLVPENVQVTRARFVREDFGPLGFLDGLDPNPDDTVGGAAPE